MANFSITLTVTKGTTEELYELRDSWLHVNPQPSVEDDPDVGALTFEGYFKHWLRELIVRDIVKGRLRMNPPAAIDVSDIDGSVT